LVVQSSLRVQGAKTRSTYLEGADRTGDFQITSMVPKGSIHHSLDLQARRGIDTFKFSTNTHQCGLDTCHCDYYLVGVRFKEAQGKGR